MSQILLTLILLLSCATAQASTDGPIYKAVDLLIARLKEAIQESPPTNERAFISKLTVSENLDKDVERYLRMQLASADFGSFRFLPCDECTAIRAKTAGNQIIVSKGIVDTEALKKYGAELGSGTSAEINLAYTGTRAILDVNSENVDNHKDHWSKHFETGVLGSGKYGRIFSITLGQFISGEGTPNGISAALSERMYGIGEFGIAAMFAEADGNQGTYMGIGPLIGFNYNEISGHYWSFGSLLITGRINYGRYSKDNRDISVGLGTKILVGSRYHFSLEGLHGFAINKKTSEDDKDNRNNPTKDNKQLSLPNTLMIGFGLDFG